MVGAAAGGGLYRRRSDFTGHDADDKKVRRAKNARKQQVLTIIIKSCIRVLAAREMNSHLFLPAVVCSTTRGQ